MKKSCQISNKVTKKTAEFVGHSDFVRARFSLLQVRLAKMAAVQRVEKEASFSSGFLRMEVAGTVKRVIFIWGMFFFPSKKKSRNIIQVFHGFSEFLGRFCPGDL